MEITTENQTTKIRILEAIERINARGEKVTNVSVKNELGGGSFSTISPYVKQWRESQRVAAPTITLPDHIRERGIQLMGAIYQECEEEAKQDNVKLKQHYEVHIADLEAENDEQSSELARLEKQLSEALTERKAALDNASELKDALHQTEMSLIGEQSQRQSAEKLASEYKENWHQSRQSEEKQRNELAQLNTTINNHVNTINGLKHDSEQMKLQIEYLNEDKAKLQDQIATVKEEHEQTLSMLSHEQDENERLKATTEEQKKTIFTLQAVIQKLESSITTATDELTELKEQHSIAKNELVTSKDRVRQLATETGEQKRDMKDLNQQIAQLNKLNGQLEAKLELQEADKPEPASDA